MYLLPYLCRKILEVSSVESWVDKVQNWNCGSQDMELRRLCVQVLTGFGTNDFQVCRVGKLPLRIGQNGNMICSLKKAGFI